MTAPKKVDMSVFNEKYHFISGAFMFFKSNIFLKIGMFDPLLFMYFEEFDLSERLMALGYHTTYIDGLSFYIKLEIDVKSVSIHGKINPFILPYMQKI